jgi:hypothetical protein
MFAEFFEALIKVGVAVAAVSYLLVWWALKKNYIGSVDSLKMMEGEFKRLSSAKSKNKKKKGNSTDDAEEVRKMNPFHNKWLSFGGGFYGVVGLLTYAVVELGEIRDFISGFDGLASFISDITPELFIGLFIDSIKNFIVAIAWPVYWMSDISADHIWIWFVVAYLSYWSGTRYALHQAAQNKS